MTFAALPPATPTRGLPVWLAGVLAIVALLAILVPAIVVRHTPVERPHRQQVARPVRVVPEAELPTVDPIAFQDLAPTDARAFNATVPFSTAPNPAARPFHLFGSPDSQARAIDCLAAAVIYEAGDDPVGERAVAQVVLNRVRHPAFPKTVCGVVFQGSERRTGCQFTFTCDGAMMRAVVPAAWDRARAIAQAALNGRVDRAVGHATHYHTDWVVPYWSSSLDKIVEVHSHLFFRWSGWWGTPGAFRSTYVADEPAIAALARLSAAHGAGVPGAALGEDAAVALPDGTIVPQGSSADANTFLVTIAPRMAADTLPALAQRACGDRPYCKFMAWSSKAATPAALPATPAQQRAMSFSYLRDREFGFEKGLWNCAEFQRPDPAQCMKAQLTFTLPAALPAKPATPEPLAGVRRKGDAPPPVAVVPTLAVPAPASNTAAER